MVANSYPNVYCGYIKDPVDAYLFGQINDGNAFSLAFNKDFGLGGELNLRYLFQTYFNSVHGKGYPEARASLQRAFQKDFARAKSAVCRDMAGVILQSDVAMTKRVCAGSVFEKHFFADCHDPAIADALRKVLTENE